MTEGSPWVVDGGTPIHMEGPEGIGALGAFVM